MQGDDAVRPREASHRRRAEFGVWLHVRHAPTRSVPKLIQGSVWVLGGRGTPPARHRLAPTPVDGATVRRQAAGQ
jgi:hypothetical protein